MAKIYQKKRKKLINMNKIKSENDFDKKMP